MKDRQGRGCTKNIFVGGDEGSHWYRVESRGWRLPVRQARVAIEEGPSIKELNSLSRRCRRSVLAIYI
jgi:hypothetical protein